MSVQQQDNLKDIEASKEKPPREDELLDALAEICFDKWLAEKQKAENK